MARGELLRRLFVSHQRGDNEQFTAAALEIIADEQFKHNNQLAKDLRRILESAPETGTRGDLAAVPRDRERQTLLGDVLHPTRSLADILLRQDTHEALLDLISEHQHIELLRAHGLQPKSKVLFCGPPGCGKTLSAEVLGTELGLPVLRTRFDAIVSSYLGETAANVRKVFDYARQGRWVILFDEFDALGKARDDSSEHGELRRVVNTFLQLLDDFTAPSLVIAATNHEHLLDVALWRRFDAVIVFPRPSHKEIERFVLMKLKNFPVRHLNTSAIARQLRGLSYADLERICLQAIKTSIIHSREAIDERVFNAAIQWHRKSSALKTRSKS